MNESEPAIIAGAGWAQMAWRLACIRVLGEDTYAKNYQPDRMTERCSGHMEACEHCEYFNVLDLAWRERGKAKVRL